jgi:aldose 1-epimerase
VPDQPTGEQYELRHGDQSAVVVELGAALRSYTVGDRKVLDDFDPTERITGGRGQLLLPWPNRVRDGQYRWQGQDLQLPLSEPTAHNAIHGLTRWMSWVLREQQPNRVLLSATVWPQPGYPFHLNVTAEYTLTYDGLTVAIGAVNLGEAVAPFGAGQHPYLTVGTDLVDDAILTVPAQTWLSTDDRGVPLTAEPVHDSEFDFRSGRAIGPQRLDTAFADLIRDDTGRVVVRLADPTGSHGTDLWLGENASYVQVFTGDTLSEPNRRRRGVAVEPMSCPPDALRSGTAVVALKPGDTHTVRWGLHTW